MAALDRLPPEHKEVVKAALDCGSFKLLFDEQRRMDNELLGVIVANPEQSDKEIADQVRSISMRSQLINEFESLLKQLADEGADQ